ncbi:MAG: MBL fold metallo-hydrolase [Cyanobacteria bacterium]|jgi:glyoxylase-like metal-dependent hydrolase (beta-lactamase superfamily II)|nr:MBL fold metallo-hydrolase [Cyanobacteria bacterium GSL.Bin21]
MKTQLIKSLLLAFAVLIIIILPSQSHTLNRIELNLPLTDESQTNWNQDQIATGSPEPLQKTEGQIASQGIISGYTTDSFGNHTVNNYWLEGDNGIVLIDTQWRISDATRALEALQEKTNKPVTNILITHAHTDHFGGIEAFLNAYELKPRIYGAYDTARSIHHDEQGFIANRQEQFGEDVLQEIFTFDEIIEDGETLNLQGIEMQTLTFYSNEATATTVFYLPSEKALFTGDIVNNKVLPVFYQGNLDGWITQLELLKSYFPEAETIYPGHGKPGAAETLINAEIEVASVPRSRFAGII